MRSVRGMVSWWLAALVVTLGAAPIAAQTVDGLAVDAEAELVVAVPDDTPCAPCTLSVPATFTVMTQKGRPNLERAVAVIREELKKIGVTVDVVTFDSTTVVQRFLGAQYDAVYYNATKTDLDPGTNQDFWFSSGSAHPWNVEQKTPATDWERRIDELMVRQIASGDDAERHRLYDEIQKIFCEHLPIVFFVAPRVYAASSARVLNVTPSDARPQLLWRPETVAVAH